MGLRLIEDRETGETVMHCSMSQWAFGSVFRPRLLLLQIQEPPHAHRCPNCGTPVECPEGCTADPSELLYCDDCLFYILEG